nr:hypothetical protein [Mycobacterium colombiense]
MGSARRLALKTSTLAGALTVAATACPPIAWAAMPFGNYDLHVEGRYDFHTWLWAITACPGGGCVHVNAIARPVAKAFPYVGDARLVDGQYVLTVDVPDGLRCDDIYYGPTVPTHDIYTWDPATLAGSLQSSFDAGCHGAPAGSYTYPFTLSRL